MEGLPTTTNFTPLIGRVVEMLRIGKHFAHFIFDDAKPDKPDFWIEVETTEVVFSDHQWNGNHARAIQ